MIFCIYGTTAEVIKLAPVLARLQQRGERFVGLCTGQHVETIPPLLDQLGLPQPDIWLGRGNKGRDLSLSRQVPSWSLQVAVRFVAQYRSLRRMMKRSTASNLLLIHGDTFTTILGALMGRALRIPVGHIEAGVRSFTLRHPFPEELIRRVTSRLARLHFAPGDIATSNLANVAGTAVNTRMNTVQDSLEMVPEVVDHRLPPLPPHFGIVSLHRFELIGDRKLLGRILRLLSDHASEIPLLFVDHPITVAKIEQYGLGSLFDDKNFIRIPKLSYFAFVTLVKKCEFAVTDSGGLQQESYCLDLPCLVHRAAVETFDGVGKNVVVSGLDVAVVEEFLSDPGRYRSGARPEGPSPSDIIIEHLSREGFIS